MSLHELGREEGAAVSENGVRWAKVYDALAHFVHPTAWPAVDLKPAGTLFLLLEFKRFLCVYLTIVAVSSMSLPSAAASNMFSQSELDLLRSEMARTIHYACGRETRNERNLITVRHFTWPARLSNLIVYEQNGEKLLAAKAHASSVNPLAIPLSMLQRRSRAISGQDSAKDEGEQDEDTQEDAQGQ